jgi:hypothetical protein
MSEKYRYGLLLKLAEFLKFFFGTFLLSYMSVTISADYQKAQLELKCRENEQKFCQQFLDRFVQAPLVERLEFAQYFSCVLGGKWTDYYKALKIKYNSRMLFLNSASKKLELLKAWDPVTKVTGLFGIANPVASESKEYLETRMQQIQQTTLNSPEEKPIKTFIKRNGVY